jgi:UDPglucose 6-dehydrogenase
VKIAVVGSGFVGEATGRGMSKHNNEVTFVDVDPEKVVKLREEGFQAELASNYKTITTDVTMFCVPTPTHAKHIQLHILADACRSFAERLKNHNEYHVMVVRSTVPPETTRKRIIPLVEKASGKRAGKDFGVVMQPEYLREEKANQDFERPWFVLIGELDERSGKVIEKLYRSFNAPIEHVSLEEAEIQKYVHNVYNAVKIAFFNEMRIAMNLKNWNADKIFRATAESCEAIWNPVYGIRDYGPFDGSCLPKDTRALLEWGETNGFDFGILRSVISENLKHEQVLGKNQKVRKNHLAVVEA